MLDLADKFKESANFFKNAKMAVSFRRGDDKASGKDGSRYDCKQFRHPYFVYCSDEIPEHEEYYRQAVELAEEKQEEGDGCFTAEPSAPAGAGDGAQCDNSGDAKPGANVISKGNYYCARFLPRQRIRRCER